MVERGFTLLQYLKVETIGVFDIVPVDMKAN